MAREPIPSDAMDFRRDELKIKKLLPFVIFKNPGDQILGLGEAVRAT